MIFNVASGKPSTPYSVPLFTYTGTAPRLKYEGNNWEIAFTGNCKITFQRVSSSIDVFLVAGGAAGQPGSGSGTGSSANAIGGAGGKGGGVKTVTKSVTTGTAYTVTIGGSGQSTSAFGQTVASGAGADGGTGAYQKGTNQGNEPSDLGDDGYIAFGSGTTLFWNGYKYGAGGGGGGACNGQYAGWREGSNGGLGYTVDGQTRRAGGQGGISTYASGKAGSNNSGGGGGGGASDFSNSNYSNFPGGAGGSGIVIIRNHR